jgi:hypothetical protein
LIHVSYLFPSLSAAAHAKPECGVFGAGLAQKAVPMPGYIMTAFPVEKNAALELPLSVSQKI